MEVGEGHRKKRILIIEDENDIAESLQFNLVRQGGYTVDVATSGEDGLSLARKKEFDLVLLDLMLPGIDGIEVCRSLREGDTRRVPIIMLTAKTEETDKLIGLEIGADDYLTKPFSMKEVLARVKAHLRRSAWSEKIPSQAYQNGDLEVDFTGHVLRSRGREIKVTRLEFALLAALIQVKGRVLTRDQLLKEVWGYDYYGGTRTIDVHIRRLRRKLGDVGECIETVFGVGYRFREPSPTHEEA